jgi:hypothetical protein
LWIFTSCFGLLLLFPCDAGTEAFPWTARRILHEALVPACGRKCTKTARRLDSSLPRPRARRNRRLRTESMASSFCLDLIRFRKAAHQPVQDLPLHRVRRPRQKEHALPSVSPSVDQSYTAQVGEVSLSRIVADPQSCSDFSSMEFASLKHPQNAKPIKIGCGVKQCPQWDAFRTFDQPGHEEQVPRSKTNASSLRWPTVLSHHSGESIEKETPNQRCEDPCVSGFTVPSLNFHGLLQPG